jgi:hypothetical protein
VRSYQLATALQAAGSARHRTDPEQAITYFAECLAMMATRSSTVVAQGRFLKALAHVKLGQSAAAASELAEALRVMRDADEPYYEAMTLALAAGLLARTNPQFSVRVLALIDRLREEQRFIGAPRDLQAQHQLRQRLESQTDPDTFAALWAEGRAQNLDTAVDAALDHLSPLAHGTATRP